MMTILRPRCPVTLTWILSLSVLAHLAGVGNANAQCNQQAPNDSTTTGYSVPPGATVYYQFDASTQNIPPGTGGTTPISQITAAFNAWSVANNQTGGSGTTFAPSDAAHPATVTILADQSSPSSGATTSALPGLIGTSNPATITFHPQAFIGGTSTSALQVAQPGYDTVYLQMALHEIGHLMGIDEYPVASVPPFGPDTSVMVPSSGVNDQGNAYPKTGPTNCDQQQATTTSSSIAAAAGSGSSGGSSGGGGVGGGGGGGPYYYDPGTCTPDYWDPSTNTLYAGTC